jgi:hypothetical protein
MGTNSGSAWPICPEAKIIQNCINTNLLVHNRNYLLFGFQSPKKINPMLAVGYIDHGGLAQYVI